MPQADAEFITGKPIRIPKALRQAVEGAIQAHLEAVEKLTGVLDQAAGDVDLEPAGDEEPSLGSQSGAWESTNQQAWASGNNDDREDEHDGSEYSWVENHGLGGISSSNDENDEPSLAHTNAMDQTTSGRPPGDWSVTDGEEECEDEGADEGI